MPEKKELSHYDPSQPLDNPKWEWFCQLYAKDDECYGNSAKAYAVAFKKDIEKENKYCRTGGSRLMTKEVIRRRLNKLMIMSDEDVERERNWIMEQRKDLSAKTNMIKHRDVLLGRVVSRHEVTNVNQLIDQIKKYGEQEDETVVGGEHQINRRESKVIVGQVVEDEPSIQDRGQGSTASEVSDERDTAEVRGDENEKEHNPESSANGVHYTRVH